MDKIPDSRIKDIIVATEDALGHAWENNHDFVPMRKYHDSIDMAKLSIVECLAVLRSCCRVRSIYHHWFVLRDQVLENFRNHPELDEQRINRLLRGIMEPTPEDAS